MAGERHRCLICGGYRVRGVFIRRAFLCRACEERLLATGAQDPGYDQFVDRFRRAWPEFRRAGRA